MLIGLSNSPKSQTSQASSVQTAQSRRPSRDYEECEQFYFELIDKQCYDNPISRVPSIMVLLNEYLHDKNKVLNTIEAYMAFKNDDDLSQLRPSLKKIADFII